MDAARAALAAMPVVLDIADRNIMLTVAFSGICCHFELSSRQPNDMWSGHNSVFNISNWTGQITPVVCVVMGPL